MLSDFIFSNPINLFQHKSTSEKLGLSSPHFESNFSSFQTIYLNYSQLSDFKLFDLKVDWNDLWISKCQAFEGDCTNDSPGYLIKFLAGKSGNW